MLNPPFEHAEEFQPDYNSWPVCVILDDEKRAWEIWEQVLDQYNTINPDDMVRRSAEDWEAIFAAHPPVLDPRLRNFLIPNSPHFEPNINARASVSYRLFRVYDDPTIPSDDLTGGDIMAKLEPTPVE